MYIIFRSEKIGAKFQARKTSYSNLHINKLKKIETWNQERRNQRKEKLGSKWVMQ
jgi:hypothetical protein